MMLKRPMEQDDVATEVSTSPLSPANMAPLRISSEDDTTPVESAEIDECSEIPNALDDRDIGWQVAANSSSAASCAQTLPARRVSFSSIEVREYPLCIGDNPGSKRGVPIAIDWKHNHEMRFSVDEYEEAIPPGQVLRIPPPKRFQMLQKTNMYSRKEIMKQLKRVEADRQRRQSTKQLLKSQALEEYVEGLKRAVLNATVRRTIKKREREFLQPYYIEEHSADSSSTTCENKEGLSSSTSSSSVQSARFEDDLTFTCSDQLDPIENEETKEVVFSLSEELEKKLVA